MKRFTSGLLVGLCISLLLTATFAFAAESPLKLIVNGREIVSDPAPMLYQDHVFVPVRFVSEALGYKVNWQEGSVAIDNTLQPVKVSGAYEFTIKINAALELLKQQSPSAFSFVQKNIKEIRLAGSNREDTKVWTDENNLMFFNSFFGFIPEGEETVFIASTIVHETCRIAQKSDATLSIFPDKDADFIANLMEYRVAQQLGASDAILAPIMTRIQDNLKLTPHDTLTLKL